jgi:hypothetical protein
MVFFLPAESGAAGLGCDAGILDELYYLLVIMQYSQ